MKTAGELKSALRGAALRDSLRTIRSLRYSLLRSQLTTEEGTETLTTHTALIAHIFRTDLRQEIPGWYRPSPRTQSATGRENHREVDCRLPQRLKPILWSRFNGGAEAPPLQRRRVRASARTASLNPRWALAPEGREQQGSTYLPARPTSQSAWPLNSCSSADPLVEGRHQKRVPDGHRTACRKQPFAPYPGFDR
jgi:hypothetical protein